MFDVSGAKVRLQNEGLSRRELIQPCSATSCVPCLLRFNFDARDEGQRRHGQRQHFTWRPMHAIKHTGNEIFNLKKKTTAEMHPHGNDKQRPGVQECLRRCGEAGNPIFLYFYMIPAHKTSSGGGRDSSVGEFQADGQWNTTRLSYPDCISPTVIQRLCNGTLLIHSSI